MATKHHYSKGGPTGYSKGGSTSPYKAGRPSGYANGGRVEGVSQRKGIAMGGSHEAKHSVEQTPKGSFQRRK